MSISVFAPISIGNVSVGFDLLGVALAPIDGSLVGDIVHIETAKANCCDDDLLVCGLHADRLPVEKTQNIVWHCIKAFNREMANNNFTTNYVQITLEKNIPTSSGLGSSACSVVAAIFALNEYYQKPFDDQQLLKLMVELEAQISGSVHYDNVAPCFLGGMQLVIDSPRKLTQNIPVFEDCYWIMAYPDVLVSTKAARDILPKEYDRQTTLKFGQNLASFIDACHRNDKILAFEFLKDVLAEPYRKHLLPKFEETKDQLLEIGCYAVGISGSGPSLFAVTDDRDVAEESYNWLSKYYLQTASGFVKICKVDPLGTRIINNT
jgi:homoserine kinase